MVKGKVFKVSGKQFQFGMLYSIKLDGNPTYYSTGKDKPRCKDGDYVQFEEYQNVAGYWNAKPESVLVLDETPQVSTGASVKTAYQGGVSKDDYWARKEARDLENDKARNVGASRNTAIAFVDLLQKSEALKLPTKQSEKADVLFEYVEHYAQKFQAANPAPEAPVEPTTDAVDAADGWQ